MQKAFYAAEVQLKPEHAVSLARHVEKAVGQVVIARGAAIIRPILFGHNGRGVRGGNDRAVHAGAEVARRVHNLIVGNKRTDKVVHRVVIRALLLVRLVGNVEICIPRYPRLFQKLVELRQERRQKRLVLLAQRRSVPAENALAAVFRFRHDFRASLRAPLRGKVRHLVVLNLVRGGKVHKPFKLGKVERKLAVLPCYAHELDGSALASHLGVKRRREQRNVQHVHSVSDRRVQKRTENAVELVAERLNAVVVYNRIVVEPISVNQLVFVGLRRQNFERVIRRKGFAAPLVFHGDFDVVLPRLQRGAVDGKPQRGIRFRAEHQIAAVERSQKLGVQPRAEPRVYDVIVGVGV